MRPINSNEIRIELNRNILIFNTITDTDVPLFYPICTEPKPDLLMRMRLDFDSIAKEYEFHTNIRIRWFYLKIRERIEALRDMKKYEIKYTY